MSLRKNSKLIGLHAFLSPSTYYWLDYDEDKLRASYFNKQQSRRGDELHTYAQQAIKLNVRQADNGTTLSDYINDAIGFRMTPEFPLFYTEDCFGTTDAISFREERWPTGKHQTLRISDLKTGLIPAEMKQLLIYAAIFFFEYGVSPRDVKVILRIYQNDQIEELIPDASDLLMIMSRVKAQAALIAYLRAEEED
jgi:hypothetical protein